MRNKKSSPVKKQVINIFNKDNDEEKNIERERIVSFVDLAGHEKYLKTTVFGVSGLFPNYGLIIIGANTGITKLTREHLSLIHI